MLQHHYVILILHVCVAELTDGVNNLIKVKSSGSDGLTCEAFIYLNQRLQILLYLNFISIFRHY